MTTPTQILREMIEENEKAHDYYNDKMAGNVRKELLTKALSRIEKECWWIDVSERLPEVNDRVLVLNCDWVMQVLRFDKYKEWSTSWFWYSFEHVTHWMPLPLPPNQ